MTGETAQPNHKSDPAMPREALVDFLNRLLEGERAGAKAARSIGEEAGDAEVTALMDRLVSDYSRLSGVLSRLVERQGGKPSEATSAFFDRTVANPSLSDRIALLCKGQQWVVDQLGEKLASISDRDVSEALEEMLSTHQHNRDRCGALVGPEQAGA